MKEVGLKIKLIFLRNLNSLRKNLIDMEEAELHEELRHIQIKLSALIRNMLLGKKQNLSKEQWEFVFGFLHLSLKEIKQEFQNQELIK